MQVSAIQAKDAPVCYKHQHGGLTCVILSTGVGMPSMTRLGSSCREEFSFCVGGVCSRRAASRSVRICCLLFRIWQVFEVRLTMVVKEKSIYVEHLLKAYKSRTCCLGYFFLRSTRFTYFNIYWYFYYFFNA